MRAVALALLLPLAAACARTDLEYARDARRAYADGRAAEAVPMLRRAIAGSPSNASYYAALGEAHLELAEYDRAESAFRTAVGFKPTLAAWRRGLGLALAGQEKWGPAVDELAAALAYAPADGETAAALARTRLYQGEPSEARRAADKGLESAGPSAALEFALGLILRREGALAEAARAFGRAADLEPEGWGAAGAVLQVWAAGDAARAGEEAPAPLDLAGRCADLPEGFGRRLVCLAAESDASAADLRAARLYEVARLHYVFGEKALRSGSGAAARAAFRAAMDTGVRNEWAWRESAHALSRNVNAP